MGKGEETKGRILDHALSVASVDGLDGLTIGRLSSDLQLSKSGLFAHFGSKEHLQRAVLAEGQDRFVDAVLRPAFQEPRGEPRIRAAFENWLAWDAKKDMPGGCVLLAAGSELDDKPGALRDFLVESRKAALAALAKAARLAIEEGHFSEDLDPQQFAFEFFAMLLGYHHAHRLLRDKKAKQRSRKAFERLIEDARG